MNFFQSDNILNDFQYNINDWLRCASVTRVTSLFMCYTRTANFTTADVLYFRLSVTCQLCRRHYTNSWNMRISIFIPFSHIFKCEFHKIRRQGWLWAKTHILICLFHCRVLCYHVVPSFLSFNLVSASSYDLDGHPFVLLISLTGRIPHPYHVASMCDMRVQTMVSSCSYCALNTSSRHIPYMNVQ